MPNNEQRLDEVLRQWIDSMQLKPKLHQARLRTMWGKLMGPMIEKHTTELRFRRDKLYVLIDSSSLREELHYGREKIRKLVNEALGEEYVKRIIVK